MSPRFTRVDAMWGLLALGVVLATIALTRRESPEDRIRAAVFAPREINDGASLARTGVVVGDSLAPLRIVMFSDFECHYCRRFHETLTKLRARYPSSVAVVYRHFPISRVGFAIPAAVAAECAAAQGKFEAFSGMLFTAQDTLRRANMERVARDAGVADTVLFNACRRGPIARARVDEDIRAGLRLGIVATPTVLIGDRLVSGEIPFEELEQIVNERVKGGHK